MTPEALGPRRLHPAWIVLGAVPTVRALALPLLVVFLTGGGTRGEALFYQIALGMALLATVLRVLSWWTFRYDVAGGELRVRSGVLGRRERVIPVERIHAVDVDEGLLQRLLGVVRVKVETAAGGSAESDVTLEALARGAAARLREALADQGAGDEQRGTGTGAGTERRRPSSDEGGELVRALSTRELLLAGATSGRVGPALAIVFGALQLVDDVLPDDAWERLALAGLGLSPRGLVTAVALFGLGAWLLALVSTVLTFWSFELRRDGDRLRVRYGLLDRRRRTIPIGRVQAVTVREGLLRQPFGLAAVHFESAGYGRDTAESGVLFPLIRTSDVAALLEAAIPIFAADPTRLALGRPPGRARPRYVLGGVWPLVALAALTTAAVALWPRVSVWWGLAPLGLIPLVAIWGELRYRDTGWALGDDGRLVVRNRRVGRTTTVTLRRRLQRRSTSANPFQRRAKLATFHAAVASGGRGGEIDLAHLDATDADALLTGLGPGRAELEGPALERVPLH